MKIHHLQLGPLRANCYIVETAPGRCVAIDIGGDSRLLLEFLKMKKLRLSKILLTHGHFDHMGGAEAVRKATGAEIYIHEFDAHMIQSASASLAANMSFMTFEPITDWTSIYGDCFINDGDYTFKVLHTPGHSRGSVCYICDDVIFSGDTLFCCSVGRTDFPDSSASDMTYSLNKLAHLVGDYKVYPGHNESTTLDYERVSNPFLKQFRGQDDER